MYKQLLEPSRLISILFICVGLIFIVFSGFSGMRISRQFSKRSHFTPRETNVSSIQPWMTLSYVSRTYGVPEQEFGINLQIDFRKYHHSSLAQIAKELRKNEAVFLGEVETFITNFQTTQAVSPTQK